MASLESTTFPSSTIRHRRPPLSSPPTTCTRTRLDYDRDLEDDDDDDDEDDSDEPDLIRRRRIPFRTRSYSLRHPTSLEASASASASLPMAASSTTVRSYRPSSLFESLDLPKSVWTLREMLLGRLSEAEQDVKRLREYTDQSELDTTDQEPDYEVEDDDEENDEQDNRDERHDSGSVLEEVTDEQDRALALSGNGGLPAKARARRRRRGQATHSARDGDRSDNSNDDELSTLAAFVKSASDFLGALRSELPSLSPISASNESGGVSESPLLYWQMSPDAREALDRFLEDHPLPAFPDLDFSAQRQRASESAAALLARVSDELQGLQSLLARIGNAATAAGSPASFTPNLSAPGRRVTELREYFAAESTRLGHALASPGRSALDSLSSKLHTLRDETSASLHRVTDGASELTALLKDKKDQAMDEASRMYHAALTSGKRGMLITYEELPHPWRNNPFIVSGYRFIPFEEWGTLLRSGFEWHNETINIHSHLIGFLSLVYLLVFMFPTSVHSLPTSTPGDTAVALLFVFAAMKCLLCSAAWHWLAGCATDHWYRGAACVDYVGISGLIAASVISIEHYGFYCEPKTAAGYMVFSGVCGIIGMVLPWKPWFNERKFKMWRIGFFLSLAGSALTPLAHLAFKYGFVNTVQFFFPAALSAMAYLVGLSFYAQQFPECANPGRFDKILASHQLWHVAIVVAVWMHWRALTFWADAASKGQDLSCALRF